MFIYCLFSFQILKLVSAIFYQIFVSHQMIALQKLWKMLFISYKKLFSFPRYSIFKFLPSPLFLSVSHFFFDVINCLNKNLITHFVWYPKKEKRYDIETLSTDRILNKEHFYWKITQKMCTRGYSQTTFSQRIACKKFC